MKWERPCSPPLAKCQNCLAGPPTTSASTRQARHYFLGTLQLSRIVDDRLLGSRILASHEPPGHYLDNPPLALQLARAAQDGQRSHASPRAMSMFTVHEARALANLGDEAGAVRALREAEAHLGGLMVTRTLRGSRTSMRPNCSGSSLTASAIWGNPI